MICGCDDSGGCCWPSSGSCCLLAGAGAAAYVGSDDTVFNRPAALGADGRPVLTAPDLLAWDGVTVTLRAQAPDGVFIGTAHPVDVADFVGGSTRVRLEGVTLDGVVAEDAGRGAPRHPEDADFWTREMTGTGPQELALDRSTSAAQWVIAPLGGTGPTTVSFGVTVEGAYLAALGVAGAGLLLLVLAVELLRPRGPRRPRPARGRASDARRPRSTAPAPVRRPGARKAARPGRRRTRSHAPPPSPRCSSRAGASSRSRRPQEAATLARTKVSLTEDDLPALYASYDERRARAVRRAGPPAYREGPWRAADRGLALAVDRYETATRRTMGLGHGQAAAHTGLRVYAARFDAYPMWALVAARARGGDPEVHVMVRDSVTSPWLMEARTEVTGDLPAVGASHHAPRRRGPRGGDRGPRRLGRLPRAAAPRTGCGSTRRRGRGAGRWPTWARGRSSAAGRSGRGPRTPRCGSWPSRTATSPSWRCGSSPGCGAARTSRCGGTRPTPGSVPGRAGVLVVDELAVGLVHLPDDGPPALLGTTFSEIPAGAP